MICGQKIDTFPNVFRKKFFYNQRFFCIEIAVAVYNNSLPDLLLDVLKKQASGVA